MLWQQCRVELGEDGHRLKKVAPCRLLACLETVLELLQAIGEHGLSLPEEELRLHWPSCPC
jgi:hypothetical protein